MEITAGLVQALREKTGLGMMLCKKALIESNGDMEKAIENLRKQGESTAAKRAGKSAREGKIAVLHTPEAAIMYEVNCETDFVARNDDFLSFFDELGKLLIAHVPSDVTTAKAIEWPAFGGRTVGQRLTELIAKIGEKIDFRRLAVVRFNPSSEGVYSYVHGNGRIGVVVKLASDKPGACASEIAAQLGKDLAMQVAASNPLAPTRSMVSQDIIAKEREIYATQAKNSGKPEKIWDKIIEGKLNKFFSEQVLVEQEYIRDTEKRVSDRIKEAEKTAGASFSVPSFIRYELGAEG